LAHRFLLEAGRWLIEGNWLERNAMPILVKGNTSIAWNQGNWFTMLTQLAFPGSDRDEIAFQYRGRLDGQECQYTYILQQSLLGQVEGEGWIAPDSIIQRYWVLNDPQRRSGFETFYRIDNYTYHLSSGILAGHFLTSTMDAILELQA
jgi:hypothetical protein